MDGGKGKRSRQSSMDDILGDLLAEDSPTKTTTKGKPGRKDDNFYSNLAAMADDNPDSDISEADVDQVAKSIADLDDMDADLFGGPTKRNSVKSRSGKPTTPRRSGNTPRSRNGGTPRSGRPGSPRRTPGSPTRGETSPRGSIKRPPPKPTSPPPPVTTDYKPGTAPGKMTDLGRESENLKPGQTLKSESDRPSTVPKAKPKIDYGEFNEDDPLAGLLSDEDDSIFETRKKPAARKPLNNRSSSDDIFGSTEIKPDEKKTEPTSNNIGATPSSFLDRPPTRSGNGSSSPETQNDITPKPALKKREERLFSDDDDMLDGLGIDDEPKTVKSSVKSDDDSRPARSVFDSLLGKDNINKHLQKSERKEFILDTKKFSQKDDEEEEDLVFGEYRPSSVGGGSRPNSRRSVRFQDDDIFGSDDKPPSRGRPDSAKSSKVEDDNMDWLELASGNRSSIDIKKEIPKPQEKKTGTFDWLGLKDSSEENEEAPKTNQPQLKSQKSTLSRDDSNDDWLSKLEALNHGDEDEVPSSKVKAKEKITPAVTMNQEKTAVVNKTEDKDDYLGLGKEVDLDDILSKKPESPTFPGSQKSKVSDARKDPFETPNFLRESDDGGFRRRRLLDDDDIFSASDPKPSNQKGEIVLQSPTSRVSMSSRLADLQTLDESPHFRKKTPKSPPSRPDEEQGHVIQTAVYSSRDPNIQSLRNTATPPSANQHHSPAANHNIGLSSQYQSSYYTSQPQVQNVTQPMPNIYHQPMSSPHHPTSFSASASPQLLTLPLSLPEAHAMIQKLGVEGQYTGSLLDSTRRRYEEEILAVEASFRNRMKILEDSNQKKEARLREETEQLMEKHLSKVRQMEEEKAEQANDNYRKLEDLERQRAKDLESLKEQHRISFSEVKREHQEALERLREAKNREVEAVASANDTSRNLTAVVEQIQNNAKDLDTLQSQVVTIHRSGLDEREITLKAKDQQLQNLQERLSRQEEDNVKERKRLEELIARMELQMKEQTRLLDEERWKMKGDSSRLEANQRSLEEEKRMWLEQQGRERAASERARENFQEENRTSMSQLNSERRALAEERMKWSVDLKLQREQSHQEDIKKAQSEAEYEVLTKTIAEEKARSAARKQELVQEESRLNNERLRVEREKLSLETEKDRLSGMAFQIKTKSAEIDSMSEMASRAQSDGDRSLLEARNLESQHSQRLANIQHEIQRLKNMEDIMAQEKLKSSKEKQELEKLRQSGLCANCRSLINGAVVPSNGNQVMNSPNMMMSPPMGGVYGGKYSSPMYNGMVGSPLAVNTIERITASIAADRSVRMWKIQALKDQSYLEEESMFLQALKQSPYHNTDS